MLVTALFSYDPKVTGSLVVGFGPKPCLASSGV